MNKQEATDYILSELAQHSKVNEIATKLSQHLNAPYEVVERFVTHVAAQSPPAPSQSDLPLQEGPTPQAPAVPGVHQAKPAVVKKEVDPLNDPLLSKTVLGMLRKNRKRSDIVIWVCERTGLEWTQAQRFVAQVQVDHNGMLTNNKILQFTGSLASIICGLMLLLAGIGAVAPLVRSLTGLTLGVDLGTTVGAESSLGLIVLGVGLTIGGLVGFYLTFQTN